MDTGLETVARDWPDAEKAAWVSSLIEAFKAHTATIGIIGLGYVGLPLACTVAKKDFRSLGLTSMHRKLLGLTRASRTSTISTLPMFPN